MGDEKSTRPAADQVGLAQAIVDRRTARGWKQTDVATRGGLSLDRVQGFESGRVVQSRASTELKLELGLEWAPGSLDAVRRGQKPLPLEDMTAEQTVRYTIESLAGAGAQEVWDKLDKRRQHLNLTWKQVAWRADLDRTTPLQARLSRKVAHAVEEGIEGAVQWRNLSIQGIMLAHDEPDCTTFFHLRPNDESGTEPMPAPALGRGLGRLIPQAEVFDPVKVIGESGLPNRAQLALMSYVTSRRIETEATLRRELDMLIEQMRAFKDLKGD